MFVVVFVVVDSGAVCGDDGKGRRQGTRKRPKKTNQINEKEKKITRITSYINIYIY